ncbi:MAG: hypothetical protein CMB80_31130 [Flammeovirgaceae bacterium]|nr:hypothetical protein [Flammeovirgaceae bacterium]|tara:strand:- start:133 stop:375 length:243 start_codon:yes stop_codon:yes gene_type:complete
MSDSDVGLDVLQSLEPQYDLPLVQLGIEINNVFSMKLSSIQVDALIHKKKVAWAMLSAWQTVGIDKELIKVFRRHLMGLS